MTCERCGIDVRRSFAGSTEVLRHVTAPKDAHYPRLMAPRPGLESAPPAPSNGSPSAVAQDRPPVSPAGRTPDAGRLAPG